jgi:hypothetical protein
MGNKDSRVAKLAMEIAELARKHPIRHEAFDALDVAKILFRPSLPPRTSSDLENLADSEVDVQSHLAV